MSKHLLAVLLAAAALTLAGCKDDDGRIKATRDQQYNQMATADAASAPDTTQAMALAQPVPSAAAPTPTAAPARTVYFVVTAIPAEDVTQP